MQIQLPWPFFILEKTTEFDQLEIELKYGGINNKSILCKEPPMSMLTYIIPALQFSNGILTFISSGILYYCKS